MTFGFSLAIVFFAALGQSTMGFGGGLIAIPLLSLLLGVKDAVMLGLVMQVLVGLLAFRGIRSLPWSLLWPMLLALLPSALLGTYFLGVVNDSILRFALACFILLFLLKTLFWRDFRLIPSKRRVWAVLVSFLGGLIQGTIGTGGPPLVIYLSEMIEDRWLFRSSLLLLLMSCNFLRLAAAIPKGFFHPALMEVVKWAIPCILLAMFLGQKLHHMVKESLYRKAMLMLLFGSSLSLLWKVFM